MQDCALARSAVGPSTHTANGAFLTNRTGGVQSGRISLPTQSRDRRLGPRAQASSASPAPDSQRPKTPRTAAVGSSTDGYTSLDFPSTSAAWQDAELLSVDYQDKESESSEVLRLRQELARTHVKLQESEKHLQVALARISELDVGSSAPSEPLALEIGSAQGAVTRRKSSRALQTRGRTPGYSETLKEFWYPVAFSNHVDSQTLVPVECFEECWVIFRDAEGKPGCLKDECAHRSCPLSLGTVQNGRVACPYHGWEFSRTGVCEKMPSTKCTGPRVASLPCVERDGLIWIWPSRDVAPPPLANVGETGVTESATSAEGSFFPGTLPPKDYVIHAELVMELPVEYGLLVENLLDLAHAPFTHTSTFARGWGVPDMVRFRTAAAAALKGHWEPYPIAMEFRPPCVVVSQIGLAEPGQLEGGQTAAECSQHLFQMHACVPSSPGKTRLLYRMGLDFAPWLKHVPFINKLWIYLAGQVLDEDLRLVVGQQDRMHRGANVWNHPVIYDKLGVRFRRWRDAVEAGSKTPPR